MKKRFLVVLMTLALSACGGDTPAPKAMHSASEGNWISGQEGELKHAASGIGFPDEIGTYRRIKVVDFAPDGKDIGVVYKAATPEGAAVTPELTLYVTYFTAGTAEAYLNSASQAIVDRFQGVQLVQEGTFTPDGGPDVLKGPFRLFRFPHNDRWLRTGAWTGTKGNWFLKARFTYTEQQDDALAKLAKMLNAELSKTGEGKQVRLTGSTKEGIAPDMDHVMKALKDIRWNPAPEPAGE